MTEPVAALREHLVRLLTWHDAHADMDAALDGIPPALRGTVPKGAPHSAWQLLEHVRLAQRDILDFCISADYREPRWPDDYWPAVAPPNDAVWDESVAAYQRDREAFVRLVRDPRTDLFARVPNGEGQTYLREVLLAADHAAYHAGQLVLVRRLLSAWSHGR